MVQTFFFQWDVLLIPSWHKQSREDIERGREPPYIEIAVKVNGTPEDSGQPDLSGSTAVLPLQTNAPYATTPGPSTQPPPKGEGNHPPMPKETDIFGGRIIGESAPRLLLNAGSAFHTFLVR